ncbi:hypothetical protein OCGS_2283 [Oceaniovalibus guishaninsula JLT2003]|uniref:Uncharacterized protein n=1 Tax=Oceaniovalibus guishaninsula JLT2003 TaxID=1231392 RepID=K2GLB5_9RHOB|nr:hypothetical protein [Oceaniovalibus guishaninsula]EKE43551.1 hypothetical protein OCGS_2283 [Oceaniovalibus guishaninsula JLT2003]
MAKSDRIGARQVLTGAVAGLAVTVCLVMLAVVVGGPMPAAPVPQASDVRVPAGSRFAGERPDLDPVAPAPDRAAGLSEVPRLPAPPDTTENPASTADRPAAVPRMTVVAPSLDAPAADAAVDPSVHRDSAPVAMPAPRQPAPLGD